MRYASTRMAVIGSMAFLLVWFSSRLAYWAAVATRNGGSVAALAGTPWELYLPLFGFLGLMIMGMAQHFVPLFSRRELYSERVGQVQVALGIASVLLVLASPWSEGAEAAGTGLWLLSSLLFVGLILATLRRPASGLRGPERDPKIRGVDRWAVPMTAAAILYLIPASAGFFLASLEGAPSSSWAATNWFSFLHLYTLGFVTLMVFGVGFHLFPRFLGAVPRMAGVKVVTTLALAGPIGVAATMPFLENGEATQALFAFFAVFEAAAAVLYAALVVDLWVRSPKRRPAARFSVAAVLWLVLGVALATLFGVAPYLGIASGAVLAWVPAHGWINLLGFAGFEVFGVTHEILPPFTPKGLKAVRRAAGSDFLLASAGLALVLVGYDALIRGDPVAPSVFVAGFALLSAMALVYLAGTLVTLRAIVPSRRVK